MSQPKRKRHNYTEESLVEAVAKIKNNEISYKKASSEYGIPISTLSDKVTGRRSLLDRTITGKISVKFV